MVQIRKDGEYIAIKNAADNQGVEHKHRTVFDAYTPDWSLADIIVNDDVKNSLRDIAVFCQHKNSLMNEWELRRFLKGKGGCVGINMYGASGTGKSISVEAIAQSLQKKLIKVDFSEIQDGKWRGTEKNYLNFLNIMVC